MASNLNTLDDQFGKSSDWIEIHNPTVQTVNLDDWYLPDNASNLKKWRFPDMDVAPGAYLVVFASGNDLRDPLYPLHANFALSDTGEYLALVEEQPTAGQPGSYDPVVIHEYAPAYPQQAVDVSYGIPTETVISPLLTAGAPGKFWIPSDDALGLSWTELAFDDTGWMDVNTAVGYEIDAGGSVVTIADSTTEFSGVQGDNNWYYGYLDVTANGDDTNYTAMPSGTDDFTPFLGGSSYGAWSDINYWTGVAWDFNPVGSGTGNPPWTSISATGMHPNDSAPGPEHYTIRRWVSEVSGQITISGSVNNVSGAGDGTTGRLFHNGTQFWSQVTNGTTANFHQTITVQAGDFVDLMIDTGPADNDNSDTTNYSITVTAEHNVDTAIDSDVQAAMHGVNSSAYLRFPFHVDDPSAIARLELAMHYDAGFTAILNGVEVANSNAPDLTSLSFDSAATAERSDLDARTRTFFDITDDLSLLQVGTNVLSIQGLNSSAADSDFLILPELIATDLLADTAAQRYFPLPTPGSHNNSGTSILGPIISAASHSPVQTQDADDIVVTATVTPTFHPVNTVQMHYRVMYGGLTTVAMVDDGTGDDALAGDGVFTATIPNTAASAGQMVRWYFTADDALGTDSRLPLYLDPIDSDEYLGTMIADPSVDSNLDVLHWFVQSPSSANNRTGTRGSLYFLGEFYDNVRTDLHGQSTAGFVKKSYDIDFNRGNRFKFEDGQPRVKDINLLTNWADKSKTRTTLAYEVRAESGGPSHFARPVRVQQNGAFFSVADLVEDGDDDYLARNGLDPLGALYKMYNRFNRTADATSGVEKKTQKSEPNTDLAEFVNGVLLTGQAQTNFLYDNVNIPDLINYLAGFAITSNKDCCHKNYYFFRDTYGTGEWTMLPWDADLTFGHNWRSGPAYFDDDIYADNPLFVGTNNGLVSAVYNDPAMREMYVRRVRSLMDEFLQAPGTPPDELKLEQMMDAQVALVDSTDDNANTGSDDADLDWQKWGSWSGTDASQPGGTGSPQTMREAVQRIKDEYLALRRDYLFNTLTDDGIPVQNRIPPQQVDLAAMPPDQRGIVFGTIEFSPATGNQDEEYLQIVNNNPFSVDISDWTLSEGISYTFAAGTVLPAGGTLYVSPNVNAFRARASGPSGGQALFVQGNYGGHLSSFGETITLRDAAGSEIVSTTYQGDPSGAQQYLRITEINYDPAALTAAEIDAGILDNDDFEFIEFTNTGSETLNLADVRLTQGLSFTFGNSTLEPGQFILAVKNQQAFELRYGAGMNIAGEFAAGSLNNGGERLKLEDALNGTIHDFSYDTQRPWPELAAGRGGTLEVIDTNGDYGNALNWRASSLYLGSPGEAGTAPYVDVVISEALTHTDLPQQDAIELHNSTMHAIDVGGWFLSDSSSNYRKFQIPGPLVIPAGGRVFFDEDDFNSSGGPDDFALDSANGDQVWLWQGDTGGNLTRFADMVEFDAARNGESFGRVLNSEGDLYFYPTQQPVTLGTANSPPRVGPLVISELMYHPPDHPAGNDLEFVEIHNPTTQAVPLENWQLTDGIQFSFAANHSIPAGGTLLVLSFDPANGANSARLTTFRDFYGIDASVPLVGPYAGNLSNGGEIVTLRRPDTFQISFYPLLLEDQIDYSDTAPWPATPDGTGTSLQRLGTLLWGNEPLSWQGAAPTPGAVDFATHVLNRRTFYDNSVFAATPWTDHDAVAVDKTALLPGQSATSSNYISYTRGLNGVMIDVANLGDAVQLNASDFTFQTGNDDEPDLWPELGTAPEVLVRTGVGIGASDRVILSWPDNTIQNTWLQVTMKATVNTGLHAADVFYFGNAIGDTLNPTASVHVNAFDFGAVRENVTGLAAIDNPYDLNRDAIVDGADLAVVRDRVTTFLSAIRLISPSVSPPPVEALMESPAKSGSAEPSRTISPVPNSALRSEEAFRAAAFREAERWSATVLAEDPEDDLETLIALLAQDHLTL